MAVYFLRGGDLVKIGTSNNPRRRIDEIKTGSAVELSLLQVIDGGRDVERGLHTRFADQRSHGEWFFFRDDLRAFIEGLEGEKAAPAFTRADVSKSFADGVNHALGELWHRCTGRVNHGLPASVADWLGRLIEVHDIIDAILTADHRMFDERMNDAGHARFKEEVSVTIEAIALRKFNSEYLSDCVPDGDQDFFLAETGE
jgi:hypothetical protein